MRISAVLGAVVVTMNFLSLLLVQPLAVLTVVPLALVPVFVLALINWSDPYRTVQQHLFPWALLLGGGLVAAAALLLNSVVQMLAGEITVIVLGAPLLEEMLKGAAVVVVLRYGAIGPVTAHSGAAVGALVGAGFAFSEDLSYALASNDPFVQTIFRLLFGPFFHATTGALIGMAYSWGSASSLASVVTVAVGLHVVWNTMAQIAVSVPIALVMSLVLTVAFTAWWGWSGRTQRGLLHQGTSGWMLPTERQLLLDPTIGHVLTRSADAVLHPTVLLRWKRGLLHASECDPSDRVLLQARLGVVQAVRDEVYAALAGRSETTDDRTGTQYSSSSQISTETDDDAVGSTAAESAPAGMDGTDWSPVMADLILAEMRAVPSPQNRCDQQDALPS